MDRWFSNTPSETEKLSIAEIRAMSPAEKIQKACEMTMKVRERVMARVRERYASASPGELRWRFAEAWLGPELAAKVREYERTRQGSR